MRKHFGQLPDGSDASVYTISNGVLTAVISDFGATLVRLYVPDIHGQIADVVLGYDDPVSYAESNHFFGCTVGRNANRIANSVFSLNGKSYAMTPNDHTTNNLHSGPDYFKNRLWTVEEAGANFIRFSLFSPHGDQGFPGNANIQVTYTLEQDNALRICYDGICDQDTVFNMTNHSFFNLAGHDKPELCMNQTLCMPARFFTVADESYIPTGELREVSGTPMDFRTPKPIGQDIDLPYDSLENQQGYDHNFEVYTNPCAILHDPISGRTMTVSTDCPGLQLYTGNFLSDEIGKNGISYSHRSGICLETQFYPDSVNHPQWQQPFVPANTPYHSETIYRFV